MKSIVIALMMFTGVVALLGAIDLYKQIKKQDNGK